MYDTMKRKVANVEVGCRYLPCLQIEGGIDSRSARVGREPQKCARPVMRVSPSSSPPEATGQNIETHLESNKKQRWLNKTFFDSAQTKRDKV